MSQTHTKKLSLKSDSLVSDLFRLVAGNITVPDCHMDPTPKALRKTLVQIEKELEIWEDELSNLLPFENLTNSDLARVSYLKEAKEHYQMALYGYRSKIEMSFLSNKKGDLPFFGVINTDSRGMQITATRLRIHSQMEMSISPQIPYDLARYYDYLSDWLLNHFPDNEVGRFFLNATPAGKMPLDLKNRLAVSQKSGLFNGGIYIIFEADWQINKELAAAKDPLVIGMRQNVFSSPSYYLIGIYDPTPMELWVADTYASVKT